MAAPPGHRASPPVLPDELVEEILLRLPPDDPACLLRASVVCKTWGCAVSHSSFRRRLHEIHGTAPVLGFLYDSRGMNMPIPNFVPTTASAFSLAAPDRRFWRALDCRHGRAVFVSVHESRDTEELLVWEPVTGTQQRVPAPAAFVSKKADVIMYPSAAVFCAADACDHRGCHGGPFRVVFVFTVDPHTEYEEYVTSACLYSSETATWAELTSKNFDFMMDFGEVPCLLVRRSLIYFMSNGFAILEYDFARNKLNWIHSPHHVDRCIFMLAEDGGLGLIQDLDSHLKLWSREASDSTDARWVQSRTIYLDNLLPIGALVNATSSLVVLGFAEGADVIFVDTVLGLFTIELLSERVTKVCGTNSFLNQLIPVVDFYTPVSRNEHQDTPLSNASEEERGEEEEEEEKVDQAQQLFDNGLNVSKEGTSSTRSNVSAMSSDLDDRVPPYGDVAPVCTDNDAAFLYEAQEMTDPLGDVPKTARMKNW